MSNPIVMGIVTGVVFFLASAITSQLTRGDLNLIPALVGGVVFGVVFGAFIHRYNNKKSQSHSDSDDSQ